jgi:uncharacterized protein
MKKDLWHFPRTELAQQVLSLFESGLSSAFTFFAPRRMGKTEFLLKDIFPAAKSINWHVFYYSFLDADQDAKDKFRSALLRFAIETKAIKLVKRSLNKVGASAMGLSGEISFNNESIDISDINLVTLLNLLAKKKKILLLLDEVQALALRDDNHIFLATLRTGLDTSKDSIKVIFTGSSREGLKKMFSSAKAPFFHFGQNLNFPSLERPFIDHLCQAYAQVSSRGLDQDSIWKVFIDFEYSPQLIRSLIERLALNPSLGIKEAKESILNDLYSDRNFVKFWDCRSQLEKMILTKVAQSEHNLYSKIMLKNLASELGVDELKPYTVQGAIRSLMRSSILIKSSTNDQYIIEDPNFASWIKQNT